MGSDKSARLLISCRCGRGGRDTRAAGDWANCWANWAGFGESTWEADSVSVFYLFLVGLSTARLFFVRLGTQPCTDDGGARTARASPKHVCGLLTMEQSLMRRAWASLQRQIGPAGSCAVCLCSYGRAAVVKRVVHLPPQVISPVCTCPLRSTMWPASQRGATRQMGRDRLNAYLTSRKGPA